MKMEIFPHLSQKLTKEEPQTTSSKRAAVSIILDNKTNPRTLLIRRAERAGDPWSGQIAFPGGKHVESDASAKDTAIRETLEEVGIDLRLSSDFLGYFQSFRTHTGSMDVIPVVFLLQKDVPVVINEEATSYLWVYLERMISDESRSTLNLTFLGEQREVPAFRIGDYVIWGLTHRIISTLVA
jgi:8-oxo-dGTP pyrophosphatase MutT (NUDIX family)